MALQFKASAVRKLAAKAGASEAALEAADIANDTVA